MSLRLNLIQRVILCLGFLIPASFSWSKGHKLKGNAKFTMYYVAEVPEAKSTGIERIVQAIDGHWVRYRLSKVDNKKANMEGTVSSRRARTHFLSSVTLALSKRNDSLRSTWPKFRCSQSCGNPIDPPAH